MKPGSHAWSVAVASSLAIVAALLWYFHDQFWWAVDEGVYAYVAQRMLAGDRLHLDLVDLHGGYVNLLNALTFSVFGENLLSLRYPLAGLTLIQSGLVLCIFRDRGLLLASTAAIAAGALSFIQFLNPSANWYALFLCFVTIAAAAKIDVSTGKGLAILGFLLGLCFLTRQLSGVVLALGVLTWLMLSLTRPGANQAFAGRLFAAFLGLALAAYVLNKASIAAIVLFGIFPLWLVVVAFLRVNLDTKALGRMLGWLLIGAIPSALPLLIYNAMNGAVLAWLRDIFVTALLIHGQDFISQATFFYWLSAAFSSLIYATELAGKFSSIGWIAAILIVPVTGYLCVSHVRDANIPTAVHPLPVIAPFWALVAIHYQIPIYLFFALPVVIAAFMQQARSHLAIFLILLLSIWSVVFQAGQPLSRSNTEIIEGHRVETATPARLPRLSLRITAEDRAVFAAVINHIETLARPDELLMTLPMDPELNFMTGRQSPVRYYGTPLGLVAPADVRYTLERLNASAPIFIVHRRIDKYLTPLSAQLLAEIRNLSPAPVAIGPFDLYRLPAANAPSP